MEGLSSGEMTASDEECGRPVAAQRVQALAAVGGRHRRVVLAADLPALGYRLYRFHSQLEQTGWGAPSRLKDGGRPASHVGGADESDSVLENARLRVELEPSTGWVR